MQMPLNIPQLDRFSDEELERFCLVNPDLKIERDEVGNLYIDMSPTHLLTSVNNSELNGEFVIWNRKTKAGKVFDSNGGFFLRDKSMKAPDVAWVQKSRWDSLSPAQKRAFGRFAPDFVLELESDSDSLEELKTKMEKWLTNGTRLGWLVSPSEKQTYIYRPGREVETKTFAETLSGEDVLIGFETVLSEVLED